MIGIFPSMGAMDGIGVSGLAAWRGLAGDDPSSVLITYGGEPPAVEFPSRTLHARRGLTAAWMTLRARSASGPVLFWHAHLLRLLPLLGRRERVIVFLHGIEAWRKLAPEVARQFRKVSAVLTNSLFTWERFVEFNPEMGSLPHRVVPLGLGTPSDDAVAPDSVPMALMIGRAVRTEGYKGHEAVIAAWPEVRRAVPDAELHMIGAGNLAEELQSQAWSLSLEACVRVHGRVSEEIKQRWIARSRCMALPSRGEGFGLAYVEAMRLGRPCLVSTEDAGREVVAPPSAGLSANPTDAGEVAAALVRLLTPGDEWDAWSVAARHRYETLYTEAHFQGRLRTAIDAIPGLS